MVIFEWISAPDSKFAFLTPFPYILSFPSKILAGDMSGFKIQLIVLNIWILIFLVISIITVQIFIPVINVDGLIIEHNGNEVYSQFQGFIMGSLDLHVNDNKDI